MRRKKKKKTSLSLFFTAMTVGPVGKSRQTTSTVKVGFVQVKKKRKRKNFGAKEVNSPSPGATRKKRMPKADDKSP